MLPLQSEIKITLGVKIKEVIATLERFAPLPLQESYDNAGLQTGLTETEVSGVLLSLDVTEDVLREAVHRGCNLVVSHHPLLFHALKHVSDATLSGRCVRFAVKNDLTLYAAHTNLDNAQGGVNFEIGGLLGLQNMRFLTPNENGGGSGVIGEMAEEMAADDFMKLLKKTFEVECLQSNAFLDRPIKTVALCGGAGDFLLDEALKQKADAFITGEMHYHDFFGLEGQIQIAVMGHYQSEQFTKDLLVRIIRKDWPDLKVLKTTINTNPVCYL